jgi:7-carboxy-7-deazaguanine synthase
MFDPQLALQKSETLQLIEIFGSIQGETSLTGLPTTFIRLAACNLRCAWCDTTYSFGRGNTYLVDAIIQEVKKLGLAYVCITGGEPLLQKNVYKLMSSLCDQGYILSLETSGSLSIDAVDPRVHIILDIKCPGSEMAHKNHLPNLSLLKSKDEVKFVIKDRIDYNFAKEFCHRHELLNSKDIGKKIEILFAPVFGELDPKVLVEWIIEDKLLVRLNLQIHKVIWDPNTKGV